MWLSLLFVVWYFIFFLHFLFILFDSNTIFFPSFIQFTFRICLHLVSSSLCFCIFLAHSIVYCYVYLLIPKKKVLLYIFICYYRWNSFFSSKYYCIIYHLPLHFIFILFAVNRSKARNNEPLLLISNYSKCSMWCQNCG